MSRGPTTFRQRDLSAAIKAAKAAGCEVDRVEITKDGRIIVITSKGPIEQVVAGTKNEWDKWARSG